MAKKHKAEPHYLLIGAGVTGSYYAAKLQRAGVKITILCRKERQDYIRENGIVLTEHYTQTRSHLAVRTVLEPEDKYDYVLIFVPSHRIREILPLLEGLDSAKAFFFFGNNVTGFSEAQRRLGDDRVLAALPSVYGIREKQVVRYADSPRNMKKPFNKVLVGETGEPNNRAIRVLRRSFTRAHIKVVRSTRMTDRLLTRAAITLPIVLGLYGAGHKPGELAADRQRLRMTVKAFKELGAMLLAHGNRLSPLGRRLLLASPDGIVAAKIKRCLERPLGAIMFAAHTGDARRETTAMYKEFMNIAKRTQEQLPTLEELYQSASSGKKKSSKTQQQIK